MFTSARFRNFKSLRDLTVHLRKTNVLVGPNNAGKSTVLDAFRALTAALNFASRRNPAIIKAGNETIEGYDIPVSQLPISLANVHSDYKTDQETSITFTFEGGKRLRLSFYENAQCVLTVDHCPAHIRSTAQFRKNFPVSICTFPTLGPLEEEEEFLTDEYVKQWQGSRRAHRMFRNIWYRRSSDFPHFQKLVEESWPGMSVLPPERHGYHPARLNMFCTEDRIARELCWAGFGFQIWLQLLTHLLNASSATMLVVDEPEIYLHPDLQHKLFQLLKASDKQLLLATHSAEIVNEAEHDDIVLINRARHVTRRISDIDGLQEALSSIGSDQNIHLARLSRGRKVLFLEGNDFRLLKRFAIKHGFKGLADDLNVTVIPIGGFTQRQRIEDAAWTFEKVLKADISIAAVLDRDYRCAEEISELRGAVTKVVPNFHVLDAKEIENFLLLPEAIARAIGEKLSEREASQRDLERITTSFVEQALTSITDQLKSEILSQQIAHRMRYLANKTSKDAATVANEAIALLDAEWNDLYSRLLVVPGKRVLAMLNSHLLQSMRVTVTPAQIIRHTEQGQLNDKLHKVLLDLDEFSRTLPQKRMAA